MAHVGISIYPNPTSQHLHIETTNQQQAIQEVEFTDVTGKLVRQLPDLETNSQSVFVGDLPSGIYLIRVSSKQGALLTVKRFFRSN